MPSWRARSKGGGPSRRVSPSHRTWRPAAGRSRRAPAQRPALPPRPAPRAPTVVIPGPRPRDPFRDASQRIARGGITEWIPGSGDDESRGRAGTGVATAPAVPAHSVLTFVLRAAPSPRHARACPEHLRAPRVPTGPAILGRAAVDPRDRPEEDGTRGRRLGRATTGPAGCGLARARPPSFEPEGLGAPQSPPCGGVRRTGETRGSP